MNLGELILKNYLSYDHAEVNFRDMGKVLIVGMNNGDPSDSNGSGKTNLFEAIGWNGWGESKAESIDLNVKEDKDFCSVEHRFEHDGKNVSIIRTRNKKNGTTTLDLIIDDVVSNGATVTETNRKISEFLNLDYETFINSVYIRQDDVYSLANSRNPSAGRDLLEKILNLDDWENYFIKAKDKIKSIEADRLKIAEFMELHKDIEESLRDTLANIEFMRDNVEEYEYNLNQDKAFLATAEAKYESLKGDDISFNLLRKSAETLKAEVASAASNLENVRSKAINFKAEQDKKALDIANKLLAESALFNEKSQIELEYSNSKEKVKDIKALEEKLVDAESKIKAQKIVFNNADRNVELAKRNYEYIESEIVELQYKIDNPVIKDGDTCGQCQTALDQNHIEHYIQTWSEKIALKKDELGPWSDKLSQASAIANDANEKLEKLESDKLLISAQIKTIKQSFQSEEVLDLKLKSVQEKLLEMNRLRKELEDIESGSALQDWKDTVKNAKQDKIDKEARLEQVEADLAAVSDKTLDLINIKNEIESLKTSVDNLKYRMFETSKNIEILTAQASDFDIIIQQKAEKGLQLIELDKEHAIYSDLAMAFSSQGIRSYILENAIGELEREANSILSRLSGNRLLLTFKTKKEVKKSKQEKLTFEVLINDGQKTFPFTSYSGGQKFRISFVLRVALSKLLLRRAHSKLEFLIIDEAVSPLDSRGVEQIMEVINELQNEFKTILVITHRNDVKQYFEKILTVNMTPNGSVLEK